MVVLSLILNICIITYVTEIILLVMIREEKRIASESSKIQSGVNGKMIIFINGSINSGKTTVAKELQTQIPKCAVVEIDAFHDFVPWMELNEVLPLNYKNAIDVIRNFAQAGLTVIVPYPLSKARFEELSATLKEFGPIHAFTLNPNLEETLKNRGTRVLTNEEKERIRYHYQIGINNPGYGKVINNTNQTVKQTAGEILEAINMVDTNSR